MDPWTESIVVNSRSVIFSTQDVLNSIYQRKHYTRIRQLKISTTLNKASVDIIATRLKHLQSLSMYLESAQLLQPLLDFLCELKDLDVCTVQLMQHSTKSTTKYIL